MKKNVPILAEVLLREFFLLGAEFVFLVPGAQIVPLIIALYEGNKKEIPQPIIANHELSAGFMAMGYSRSSGKIGVVLSIGGPGAAYMVGAGICAKADDVPVFFVTGNIPPKNFGKGEFQDASPDGTNDSAIFQEAIGNTMICNRIEDIGLVLQTFHQSFSKSIPFHVQIPIDVQKEACNFEFKPDSNNRNLLPLDGVLPALNKKTVLLLGRKVLDRIDRTQLQNFVRENVVPVVTDMKTRGVLDETDKESIGYIGFNSDVRALEAFNPASHLSADNIVTAGVKNELVNQYINKTKFKIYSLEPQSINYFLENAKYDEINKEIRENWLNELNKIDPPGLISKKYKNKVAYSELLETINQIDNKNVIYCLDAGQIRRAGSIFLTCRSPRSLIQSDTLSPMGSGICASIGAQLANSNKRVISLFGDGSMRMHGMEIATAVRYKAPVIFILCDNQCYASTANLPGKAKKLPKVDWGAYASLIGIKSFYADNKQDFSNALDECFSLNEPTLIWTVVPYLLEDEMKMVSKVEYDNWLSEV